MSEQERVKRIMERIEQIMEEETIEQRKYEAAKSVLENGLTDYRNAADDYMRAINAWHDATDMIRKTPEDSPLYGEACRQYEEAVEFTANLQALSELERMRFEREWNQKQDGEQAKQA